MKNKRLMFTGYAITNGRLAREVHMNTKFNHYLPVYKNLEEEVINLSKYIQINDNQLGVYSMHIADLIVRCAMEIEAISKELYWENGGVKVYGDDGKERDLFFDTDCINYLENIWGICEKEIIVSSENFYFEKEENIIICPLNKGNKRSGAKWNKAYQAVKHDRKASIKQGNVKNLILALGALYILNLYYLDRQVDLGATNTPVELFDSRMGSLIFSSSIVDATINVPMGSEPGTDVISDELKEKCKKAVYIIRYKRVSWERINKAVRDDNEKLIKAMLESDKLEKFIQEHANEYAGDHKEHLLSLVSKVLGSDYVRTHNSLSDFAREFVRGEKEAILNKNEAIY